MDVEKHTKPFEPGLLKDPEKFDIKKHALEFLSTLPAQRADFTFIPDLTSTVSAMLADPKLTLVIATAFRPILVDLCARWLHDEENTEEQIIALSLLTGVHEELFPILSVILQKPKFQHGPLGFVKTVESIDEIDLSRLHRLLLAYFRLLQINRQLPETLLWSLAPLAKLIWGPHPDRSVRFLAIQCYAFQAGMAESDRIKLETASLGELCLEDCPIEYGVELDGTRKVVDGWVLPMIEERRILDAREAITDFSDYQFLETKSYELSPWIVNFHGILLLRSSCGVVQPSGLIPTPSTIHALQALAIHFSLRIPILLTSSPSSGKSLLISHLASHLHPQTKNQVINIHLADTSLDARSLLGSYVSSVTSPGTFEWKEGVLVRAMREGKWIVFEDVDKASSDVLGVIKPLIESLTLGKWIGGRASIEVPSRGRVVASEHFAVFATRSIVQSSRKNVFPKPTFLGAGHFYEITVPSPTQEELRLIVDSRFPQVAGSAAAGLIHLWESVRNLGSVASTRDIGLRELERFCRRVCQLLPPSVESMDVDAVSLPMIFPNMSLREEIYLEARDVFFGAGALTSSARLHLETIASTVADLLGIETERQEWLLNGRTPEFSLEQDVNGKTVGVRIGNTRLAGRPLTGRLLLSKPSRPFAMHRPAITLLSRIGTAVSASEPVLLTGETGTGKTSVITHLANMLNRPLIALNLSHQTESSDLLGGFKPVDARIPGSGLQDRFSELFAVTFSRKKNEKFEDALRKAVLEGKWKKVVGLWKESVRLARDRIRAKLEEEQPLMEVDSGVVEETPRKRRKVDQGSLGDSEARWEALQREVEEFEVQHVQGKSKFAFSFVEGPLVNALRAGDWVLLDEINLASPETLECITGLLDGPTASITLTEQGSLEPVSRHPDFRLFACMNPATDVGKKDLPTSVRSRFTEIEVAPPDADRVTLLEIITQYIGSCALGDKAIIMNVAGFYVDVKKLAEDRQIVDGSNHRPHYSMRTLARALTFASELASAYSLRRSVWEGCLMAFTMVLDRPSSSAVTTLAQKHLLAGVRNPRSLLTKEPSPPAHNPGDYVKLGPFYLEKGPLPEDPAEDYIITPSVETKLVDLARIMITRRFPVLIEGPTSSGKTSSIEYLARRTGHRFIRINNHEHTDIQEYLGSYVTDQLTGKLAFRDGLLVKALRNGDWIVLDELNLAPTDVLEALNRLLDDNRELVIPETQEVVRPHPHFMLFATQNPPGLYAGRKVLSRAFRNRFLEVHFDDVPQPELETILCQRCRIAPSYGQKIVAVFQELQKRRQAGRVFESKQSFATLRDLFRWAERGAIGYQELAEDGYMLLAERVRRDDDRIAVKDVIESIMRVKIDEKALYDLDSARHDWPSFLACPVPQSSDLVWTSAMQRLLVLLCRALLNNEPVLLVGETGSGKTSVCQVYAASVGRHLHSLNCHQNTETADLIGGLRPVRNRTTSEAEVVQEVRALLATIGSVRPTPDLEATLSAVNDAIRVHGQGSDRRVSLIEARSKLLRLKAIFEWNDGPLVNAMRAGEVFLIDEISLADDSVLERLNSVLEPSRTIVLAEKGGDDVEDSTIQAAPGFKLVATMNPGGDYGKKELSPALRNRFTEIWVPAVDDRRDLELIVSSLWKFEVLRRYTTLLLDFVDWLCEQVKDRSLLSLRDILAWVNFSNSVFQSATASMIPDAIFHHAAHMTYLDGLASLPQLSSYSKEGISRLRATSLLKLHEIVPLMDTPIDRHLSTEQAGYIRFGSFSITTGPQSPSTLGFNFEAQTTWDNGARVVRACQVSKPVLLEGSPGVGKTSLITALAKATGHHLCRVNLSDQTDLTDLFGSDLPVEGGSPGEFAWRDAEFLRALQDGHWVLLDEMNLAPQAVLEGLNAVLDHRGTVFLPELGRSFVRHPSFRIFAAQNPLHQGGGRKGLPKSFVNRFTKVYVNELVPDDLTLVCRSLYPEVDANTLQRMVGFNTELDSEVTSKRSFAREGGPWEFNLRDILRWLELLRKCECHPSQLLTTVYSRRLRLIEDRRRVRAIFDEVFETSSQFLDLSPHLTFSSSVVRIGNCQVDRKKFVSSAKPGRLIHSQLSDLESTLHSASCSWLTIVSGPSKIGKTQLVRNLANMSGSRLREIYVSSATDTMDLLGSFEQVDAGSRIRTGISKLISLIDECARISISSLLPCLDDYDLLRQNLAGTLVSSLDVLQSAALCLLNQLKLSGLQNSAHDELLPFFEVQLLDQNGVGRFEWIDGPLLNALRNGDWVLIDGANLSNPSVLDRLNSLCEQNGVLALGERGYVNGKVELLKPHPDFRLFMSVDPQFGELSRAMRNRGIEVFLDTNHSSACRQLIKEYLRLPLDSEDSCFAFDISRRGVHPNTPVPQSPFLRKLTWGGLDQYSDLTNISTMFSLICEAPDFSATDFEGFCFFFIRSIALATLPRLNRLMKTTNDGTQPWLLRIGDLLATLPTTLLIRVTSNIGRILGYSPLETDPVDFFMNRSSFPELGSAKEEKLHSVLLRFLNLLVCLFVNDKKFNTIFVEPGGKPSMNTTTQAILNQVRSLLRSVREVASEVLGRFDLERSELKEVEEAAILLKYGQYAQRKLETPAFDYSVIQCVSNWMVEVLHDCSPIFEPLDTQARELQRITTPRTGLGLLEMWKAFRTQSSVVAESANLSHLELLACNLINVSMSGTRRIALELITARTFGDQKALNAERQRTGLEFLRKSSQDLGNKPEFIPSLLNAELHLITRHLSCSMEVVERFIQITSEFPRGPLTRFAYYQNLLWSNEREQDPTKFLPYCLFRWLKALWDFNPSAEFGGPSLLLQPVYLLETRLFCGGNRVSLDSLNEHRAGLRRHIKVLLFGENRPKSELLTTLLHQAVIAVAFCFGTSFESSHFRALKGAFESTQQGVCYSSATLLSHLEKSKNLGFLDSLRHELRASLLHLDDAYLQNLSLIGPISQAWISLGQMIMRLYVPDIPVDPAVSQNCLSEFLSVERGVLVSQKTFHMRLEQSITGNVSNSVILYLESLVEDLSKKLSSRSKISLPNLRQDIGILHAFWTEVSQFQSQVIDSTKVSSLVDALRKGTSAGLSREQAVQQTISGFVQRLNTAYPAHSDISWPIELSLQCSRFGLRLLTNSTEKESSAERLLKIVSSFPSIKAATDLHTATEPPVGTSPFQHILTRLSGVAFEISTGVNILNREKLVEDLYSQSAGLWMIEQARSREEERASESLYRHKHMDYDALTDTDIEQQELLEMFPDFENVLDSQPDDRMDGIAPKVKSLIGPHDLNTFVRIHFEIFQRTAASSPVSFATVRKHTLFSILDSFPGSFSNVMDEGSIAFQLHLLKDRLFELENNHVRGGFNFYVDPDALECSKAVSVVLSFHRRLEELLLEWPEHMVLQNLRSRCQQFLQLQLYSPLAQLLSGLEQLLQHSEDWEIFANRDNTLKFYQQGMTDLIVQWRRIELSCWKELLQSQADSFGDGAHEWWFRLYNVLIKGSLDVLNREQSGDIEAFSEYLGTLVPLLDNFVTSGPIGQFQTRIVLLESFTRHIEHLSEERLCLKARPLKRVQRVLRATVDLYSHLNGSVSDYLQSQRAPLERDIQSYIKLASWKDVNVQALKQSAKRTHHQLFKLVRRFRDILREPVAPQLKGELAGRTESGRLPALMESSEPLPLLPSRSHFPANFKPTEVASWIANLEQTFANFAKFASIRAQSIRSRLPAHVVDSLAIEIITVAEELSQLSVPFKISKEGRERLLKAFLVRKRKAWSDLLKELKRGGLLANVKADILRQQSNELWLREQVLIPLPYGSISTGKGEEYYRKLRRTLPDLRSSLREHHADLTTRELQRGFMFLESGFSIALESRTCLAKATASLKRLQSSCERLKLIVSSPNIALVLEDSILIDSNIDFLSGLLSALEETAKLFDQSDDPDLSVHLSQLLREQFKELAGEMRERLGQLKKMESQINLTKPAVLLQEEHLILASTSDLIAKASRLLSKWEVENRHLGPFLQPTREWINSQHISTLEPFLRKSDARSEDSTNTLIGILLVTLQNISSKEQGRFSDSCITTANDSYIRDGFRIVCEFTTMLEIDTLVDRLEGTLQDFATQQSSLLSYNLARLMPFLDRFLKLVEAQVESLSGWNAAIFKLDYVLCSIMTNLTKKGFCKPPDAGDEEGGQAKGESTGGVGLGEGIGNENVSQEIGDESQVEGLKGEEDENNQQDERQGEENAIEMADDFGGELEDVPESDGEDKGNSDEESRNDPDEQIGDLDNFDPGAVDEKIWGDEKGDEKDGEGKPNEDHSKNAGGDSEMVAKEEDNSSKRREQTEAGQTESGEAEEDEGNVKEVANDEEVETDPIGQDGAPLEDHIQDADTLNLPEDMKIDSKDDVPGEDEMVEDEIEDVTVDSQVDSEEADRKGASPDGIDELESEDSVTDFRQAADEGDEGQPEVSDGAVAQPDVSGGAETTQAVQKTSKDKDPSGSQAEGSAEAGGQESGMHDNDPAREKNMNTEDSENERRKGLAPPEGDPQDNGSESTGLQRGETGSDSQSLNPINSNRSLGDSSKETQRKDDILDGTLDAPQTKTGNAPEAHQIEYVRPDDEDQDMQALGPAGEEQATKLKDLTLLDNDYQAEQAQSPMDVDRPNAERPEKPPLSHPLESNSCSSEAPSGLEGALTRFEVGTIESSPSQTNKPPAETEKKEDVPVPEDKVVEAELRNWQTEGFATEKAEHIWRLYESLTHDLAYTLCEQLRLILEPTQATRLKGDYRTGKRLNMKKIIPYIASDYTKDKIWLRRTRPSQREYQVLIALDDSKSMAESRSVHLAYQTLALVSKALSRLEVGDIAVAKFGETVEMLHSFDGRPFSDQAGTQVMSSFKFDQKATNVLALVETSLRVLEQARERRTTGSSSAADLWQLEIIISDGLCNHEKLRTVLRKAEEQRVMIVFIILDSLHSPVAITRAGQTVPMQTSILNMQQGVHRNVEGRMELQMERYLDSFPFEYYVVLRNVEALPAVLSDTIRQFFERISEA